jgi:hypothetical protein
VAQPGETLMDGNAITAVGCPAEDALSVGAM